MSNLYPHSISSALDEFLGSVYHDVELTDGSRAFYRNNLPYALRYALDEVPDLMPQYATEDDVRLFRASMIEEGLAVSTQKDYFATFKRFLEFYDNYIIDKMHIRWPVDTRPTVDWLTLEQAKYLLDYPMNENQELLVHVELCLLFRRIELARMTVNHVHNGWVDIVGKGPVGGKLRRIPFHRRSADVFDRYMSFRSRIEKEALERRSTDLEMPNRMMVYRHGSNVRAYSMKKFTGYDRVVMDLSKEVGFHFSHHTLRRTGGRLLYKSPGVDPLVVSKMLGHDGLGTTLLYLGINMDDMQETINKSIL